MNTRAPHVAHHAPDTVPRWGLTLLLVGLVMAPAHGAPAAPVPADSPTLGSLIYTPEERRTIERKRHTEASDSEDNENQDSHLPPETIVLDGFVKRDTGKGTIWIDQQPQAEGEPLLAGQATTLTPRGLRFKGHTLHVGQTLNLGTGERTDPLPPDSLRIRPAP